MDFTRNFTEPTWRDMKVQVTVSTLRELWTDFEAMKLDDQYFERLSTEILKIKLLFLDQIISDNADRTDLLAATLLRSFQTRILNVLDSRE